LLLPLLHGWRAPAERRQFDRAVYRAQLDELERDVSRGVIGEAERYAAKVFGADRTYFVTNGTSTSNKVVLFGTATRDDVVLVDRNCHKSIEQGLVMTGAVPVFFIPTRNRYGIIGPIPKAQLTARAIKDKIARHPLKALAESDKPVYAVITNCTYDGMCYNAVQAQTLLAKSVDQIHFDEAWYAYARFNPLYRDRFAMRGNPADHDPNGPTVFATQSTHKLLAALSQASYIHIRNGKKPRAMKASWLPTKSTSHLKAASVKP